MSKFNSANLASEVLGKIGSGSADADFARAIEACLDAAGQTGKKAKLKLTITIQPREELGCVEMRADITTALPRLPAPASQFHVGPNKELMDQTTFLLGGGKSEAPQVIGMRETTQPAVQPAPAPAPLAEAPKPQPIKG
jgi:hypothetical protein